MDDKFTKKRVPTIGGKSEIQQSMQELAQFLDPILGQLSAQIEDLQFSVAVLKEVNRMFPDKIEVTVRQEKPLLISDNQLAEIIQKVKQGMIPEKEKK